jgi:hypothetical protein
MKIVPAKIYLQRARLLTTIMLICMVAYILARVFLDFRH